MEELKGDVDEMCSQIFSPFLSLKEFEFRDRLIDDLITLGYRAEILIDIILNHLNGVKEKSTFKCLICEMSYSYQ
jgi:hypothetical protein